MVNGLIHSIGYREVELTSEKPVKGIELIVKTGNLYQTPRECYTEHYVSPVPIRVSITIYSLGPLYMATLTLQLTGQPI